MLAREFAKVVDYQDLGPDWKKAIPTIEHFLPLIYALGAVDEDDTIRIINEGGELGSITMTSFIFEHEGE